jgi:gliding motility-associated-like protein
VTGSGGTSPYQYDIDLGAPQATGTFSGLAAGLHIMGIGDANGCLDSIHILLGSPTKLIADTLSTVEPLCFGGANGAITLGVSGGTYPYTYAWPQAPAITDSLATGLAAGTYSAYITDAKGCKDTVKTVLGQPTRLSPVLTMDSETCNGLANASITVTTTNGTPPYTYSLDAGTYQSSGTFSAIAAGVHTVTVKDANGCDSVISFTIYQPPVLTASITYTRNATCSGTCNGSILAAGSGGTTPYTYSKDGVTFSSVDSFTALCAAAYTITVKDAKGCTATATSTVTQPPVLALTLTSSTQPTCFGLSNGTIVVTGSGGTSPYQYDIDLGAPQATGTFSGLAAGLHIMGIGDANGCLDSIHILLGSPTKLIADTLSTVEPLCFGGANGAITLGVSGGTYPYSYAWPQAPAITDSLATGLAAGTYSAYITDAKGCKDTVTTILAQPTTIIPVIASISEVTCSGLNNGSVTITATGGTGALSYELDASGTFQASGTFSGLAAGPHTVTVQDANLCSSPITFTITQPQPLAATLAATVNALCFGVCDGSFIVTPSGGTSPYQYSTDGVTFLPSDTIGSLCANPSYTITVKDSNNCQTTLTGAITQPASVVVTPVDSFPPLCYDGSNASFDVLATGGSGTGYTYSVNGGPFQANGGHFTGVAPGQDTVVVKDGNGCSGVYIITVPNVTSTSSFTTTGINELCFGGSTGAAYVTVSGTVTPYTYLWRPTGATTDTLSNIPIGTYTVDVTDAHGCKVYGADSAVTITQPAQIHAVNVSTPDSCFNGVDGCVAVTLSGGTGAFTSSWSNGSTLTSPCGLPAGTYTDTVTDANGCKYINGNIIVTQPTQIGIVLDSVTAVSCVGSGNGAIAITDTGGTPGYTYLWSQGATSDPLTGLSVGTYTVTVTDAHLCTAVGSFTVGIDSPLVLNATKSNVFCSPLNNGSITLSVTGGLPAYQYVWSNGAVTSALYGLSVGIDSVTVTDSRGCAVDTGFVITNDSSFRLAAIPDTQTIKEGDNVPLGLELTFGAGDNYASITWTPAAGLSCTDCQAPTAAPFTTTQYQVSVTTDSGCVATAQVLVTVLPQHQLYVPNAFTPNNDGINDYWEAFGYKQTWVYVQAQVYDRWGEKIYESNDINFQWDGTYKGTLVQPGDYVYTFKVAFVDGYVISNKGTITVIR